MKITEVQIDGFGIWSDLKLDHIADGLTVFYGPNEAGKTTLLEFIRGVFYGYSGARRTRYLPPVHGGRSGGALDVVGAGGRFTIKRTPGSGLSADDLGRVQVLSSTGARQGQHVLGSLLAGIDDAIFQNVFAVGLRELQELGTLNDTEAAAQLYKLTSGLDRVSLVDVMRQLETRRNAILAADGSDSELTELVARREQLQTEIKELAAGGRRWKQLAAQRNRLRDEVAALEQTIEQMERESRAVEIALQVRDDWNQRVDVRQQLRKLGKPAALPPDALPRLEQWNEQIALHRTEIETIRRKGRAIREEAAAQPISRPLWARAGQIQALGEHEPWMASLEGQIERLEGEIGELEADLRGQWEQLGLVPDEMPEFTPEIAQRATTALAAPARAVQQADERLATAKSHQGDARREAEQLADQLQAELADTGQTELAPALEEAGQRVALFRRRLQLEERLDKMERHRKELEEDRHELVEEQLLPVSTLVWCGVPFVLGVTMVLASLFWEWVSKLGWTVTILGLVCWAVAVITKVLLERSMRHDLDDCIRQLDKVRKQIGKLKEERHQLDQQLPSGGGPLDARLTAAEQYVERLEQLTPLETQRQTAAARAEEAREKITQAADRLREARAGWREALRTVDLPESFQPEHIQKLSEGNGRIAEIGRRLQTRRQELRDRRSDLAAIAERIQTLRGEVEITAGAERDPHAALRQMSAALSEQRGWIERRKELKHDYRQLKKGFREHTRQLRQLLRQRRLLINQAHAADEGELRRMAAKQEKIEQLTVRNKELTERITLAVGTQCTEQAVAEVMESHPEDTLESYWDLLLGRLQETQERLTELHQTRGEVTHEMKALAEDRRLANAKLQRACVDQQIRQAVRRWRVLVVTSLMLEAIRQIYETERQPETLAEASGYLERLTEGRYRRIWTPLSEDNLRVDTADGQAVSLDVLSQGTREAVFVALRLALAAAYARRGAVVPLVLDDVLVNFDHRRAKAAAGLLRDFANAGHQMLLFTCHRHILTLFEASGVETRILPLRDELCEAGAIDDDSGDDQAPESELGESSDRDAGPELDEQPDSNTDDAPTPQVEPAEESAPEPVPPVAEDDVASPVDESDDCAASAQPAAEVDASGQEDEPLLDQHQIWQTPIHEPDKPLVQSGRWWEADGPEVDYRRKAAG